MYLREQGIDFEEKDVNESVEARRQFSRLKLPGVPCLLVGDEVIIGFNKEKILDLCK